MQNSSDRTTPSYAGFWVRAAAYLVDKTLVAAGLLIVRLMISGVSALLDGTGLDGRILFQYTWKDILLYLLGATYFVLCTYYTGTTVGKRLFQLRVVSEDGDALTLTNVIYRETVGRFLSSILLMAGYLMAGLDKEKRGLHDILCDTRVIYARNVKVIPVQAKAYKETFPHDGSPMESQQQPPYSTEDSAPYSAPLERNEGYHYVSREDREEDRNES